MIIADKAVEAFENLYPLAQRGVAQAKIGFMFFVGQGVKHDISEAIKWLALSAEKGQGEAAHNLGTLYLTSEPDFPRNHEKSKYWCQKAKELGFLVAPDDWYE